MLHFTKESLYYVEKRKGDQDETYKEKEEPILASSFSFCRNTLGGIDVSRNYHNRPSGGDGSNVWM